MTNMPDARSQVPDDPETNSSSVLSLAFLDPNGILALEVRMPSNTVTDRLVMQQIMQQYQTNSRRPAYHSQSN